MRRSPTRRDLLTTAAATSLGAAVVPTATTAATDATSASLAWTSFHADPQNTGTTTEEGPRSEVTTRWRFQADAGIDSSPIVVNGTVYVGSDDSNVYAIDATSGTQQWAAATGGSVFSTPAYHDDTIYVGSTDTTVYALDTAAGAERWTYQTGGKVFASPAVHNDTVYVTSTDGRVYALHPTKGTARWTSDTGASIFASPAVAESAVVIATNPGDIVRFDPTNGIEQWRVQTDGPVIPTPAIRDGTVYAASGATVYALNLADGRIRWSFETNGSLNSSPAVSAGTVYIGSDDHHLYALDAATGAERWRFKTGHDVDSSPAVTPSTVYVGSVDERLYAVDTASGTKRWALDTGAWINSSPAVDGGQVYVGNDDGQLYALTSAATSTAAPTSTASSPHPGSAAETAAVTPTGSTATPPLGDGGDGGTGRDGPGGTNGGLLPFAVGGSILGTALVGGALAWWYEHRSFDGDSGAAGADRSSSADGAEDTGQGVASGSATGAGGGGGSSPEAPNSSPADASGGRQQPDRGCDEPPVDDGTSKPADAAGPPDQIPTAPQLDVEYTAFERGEPLGKGGNADVYRTSVTTDGDAYTVAVKEPRVEGTLHGDVVERFREEAETWEKLDAHDHVVGVVDWDTEPMPWIAMEYMDGGHLGDRMGEMDVEQALWTAIAVTKGVRHAHRHGVAHLDLKPENVLFRTVDGAWDVPKVADWGLSKHLLEHSKSIEGMSPHYAAPEQFEEEYGPADDLTDVYQLGAVFYELFTGRPPFEGRPTKVMRAVMDEQPTPPGEIADLPDGVGDILLTALAKEKTDRYESALLLRNALQEVFDVY